MPWHIEEGGGTCATDQWAVIKDDDGTTAGCHDTKHDAEQQLAALYAQEDEDDSGRSRRVPMEMLRDLDVVRAVPLRTELRAADTEDAEAMPVMVVRFSVFDTWYEIDSFWEGTFLERTVKGAFTKTMRESGSSIKVLFNHGFDFHIGDKILGVPESLREDDDAATGNVPLLDTSYNRDLIPGLDAGGYGSSFMFRVIRDEWNDDPGVSAWNPKGLPERSIKEVRLFEFGPVTWPANPDATAGLRSMTRSMTDEYYEHIRSREPQRYETLLARVRSLRAPAPDTELRTPDADAAPDQGTSADGAAPETTDAPDTTPVEQIHPSGLTPSQRAARIRAMRYPFLERQAS